MLKISPMQRKLVEEHLLCGDLDHAALAAGSKAKTVTTRRAWASATMAKPHVGAYYKQRLKERKVLFEVKAETFFAALADIAKDTEVLASTRVDACTAALDRMGRGPVDRSEVEVRGVDGAAPVDLSSAAEELRERIKHLPPAVIARMKSGMNGSGNGGAKK